MKTIVSALLVGIAAAAFAQDSDQKPAAAAPAAAPTYDYDQKPAAGRAPLVTAEQAQGIVERFKAAYATLGNPRLVIYVNRELIDEDAGLKLVARTEKVDSTTTSVQDGAAKADENARVNTVEKAARENRYRRTDRKEVTLSDRQTVRDVERLFGRPFRMAGARLADQRVATQLMADRPVKSPGTEAEQARKDREALERIADVAVEILVSSKKVDVAELSGTRTYELPDVQVTALRLKDSEIIGQASSSDVLRVHPGYAARSYDVREITEAVALALMEDMLPDAPATAESK